MTETAVKDRASTISDDTLRDPLAAGDTQQLVVHAGDMRWLSVPRDQMRETLRTSLYPGADPKMVDAVMEYCRAAGLNVMLRPVHIVPMWIPKKEVEREGRKVTLEGTGCMRDVIMPSINHYRVQAHRTGKYMGLSKPEWGPMVEYNLSGTKVMVPESVSICVKVRMGDDIVEFWHEEYYLECYATAGRDTKKPNAMWEKRGRGQMAKTCEAGALRKAFPELGDYTAEEMEGRSIDLERQPDGSHAPRANPVGGVRGALDAFSGDGAVKATKVRGAAKATEKVNAAPIEDAIIEPEDTGEVPGFPAEALADWRKGKWSKAWRFVNEALEGRGPGDRQAIVNEYPHVFRIVANQSEAYAAEVDAVLKRHGTTLPAVEDEGEE